MLFKLQLLQGQLQKLKSQCSWAVVSK